MPMCNIDRNAAADLTILLEDDRHTAPSYDEDVLFSGPQRDFDSLLCELD